VTETVNIDVRELNDMLTAFVFLGILSFSVYRKYGALIATSTFYFFASSMIIFMNPFKLYNRIFASPDTKQFYKMDVSVSYISAQAFALGILIFIFVAFANKDVIKRTFNFLKYFSVVNALIAITSLNGAAFWSFTMDLTLATFFLPFFIDDIKTGYEETFAKSKVVLDALCVITIISATLYRHPITPMLMIAGCFALYFLKRKTLIAFGPLFLVLSLFGAWAYTKNEPGHLTERIHVWDKIVGPWSNVFNEMVGSGTGTYRIVGPILQQDSDKVFYFAHNEYLQVIIEQGLIGIILLISIIALCFKSTKTKSLCVSLTMLVVASFVQFPLRTGVGFLFCLLIARMCLDQRSQYE
jgi:hypothetical protein